MSVSLNGTNGLTFADSTTQNTGGYTGFRNRIINGDMKIDQRNAGASVAVVSGLAFPVDRTQVVVNAATGSTAQRSSQAPSGFINSLAVTVGTGASPTPAQQGRILHVIEGLNVADLAWGTASAASVTLSFWVRSSVTGTFAGGIYGGQGYVFTYVINSANTWEYKTVTILGSTSGTWPTDNSAGINVNFDLGTGTNYQTAAGSWGAGAAWATSSSVKLCATTGATFYITGVQLEKGSVATPFENRPYGTELQLCQRYYQKCYSINVVPGTATSDGRAFINFPVSGTLPTSTSVAMRVEMRSAPTVTPYDFNGSAGACFKGGNGKLAGAASVSTNAFSIYTTDSTNTNEFGFMWTASAEL